VIDGEAGSAARERLAAPRLDVAAVLADLRERISDELDERTAHGLIRTVARGDPDARGRRAP
jgi:hypothetical protein